MMNVPLVVALAMVVSTAVAVRGAANYTVTATRINSEQVVIRRAQGDVGSSAFDYNYNPAYVPLLADDGNGGLLVRVQNNASASTGDPYAVTPSRIAYVRYDAAKSDPPRHLAFAPLSASSVVLSPRNDREENYGVEDPRVALSDSLYYVFYSAVQRLKNGTVISRLALSTTRTPSNTNSYKHYGPVFADADVPWSKSGALLMRKGDAADPHLLFWGDSGVVKGLQVARSTETPATTWRYNATLWLPVRAEPHFDSYLVEAGPPPLRLSDGNYLFVYNSARVVGLSDKPGYTLEYNAGWVVLDGNAPTRIVARSAVPLLSPKLAWERRGLTPRVVFVEGMHAVRGERDTFRCYYGAADSYVGAADIRVTLPTTAK